MREACAREARIGDRYLLCSDGLSDEVRSRAETSVALSLLTLPHALARVMLAEALYRAHTVNEGHPYHRE